ncbi:MAG: hypothetical protein O2821_00845 [Chloroflexi bacterium]|nr:hypothetical protein [Chloroflexota bacterium]MDA1226641.1 hypothetical protein [Chloroflexota bacterium]
MATTTISNKRDDILFGPNSLPVEVTGMQSMASKMWVPFLGMGFMIVVAAFIVGLVTSGVAADYFAASKITREAATTGSALATQIAFIESTKIWLPALKFFGVGMMLGGVTFLLATILGALRTGGGRVQEALGAEVRIIKPPMTAKMFPMLMMMGTMILMTALIISIPTSALAYGYWNHSIATQLNPALEGSGLLANLGTINAIKLWLEPLKFVGMASLFAGIGLALATIVRVLRWQSNRLWEMLS